MLNAIEQGIITPMTKKRLDALEEKRRNIETDIVKEKMKHPLLTEEQVRFWFERMREYDITVLEQRKRLIDTFVNAIFVYNDRLLFTFNYKRDAKTVLFSDLKSSDISKGIRPNKALKSLSFQGFIFCLLRNFLRGVTQFARGLQYLSLIYKNVSNIIIFTATSLKSFRADGRFDVICSGSMMGINYHEIESNSVGNKEDCEMHSMDFEEFLWAKGYKPEQIEDLYQHMLTLTPFSQVEYNVMLHCLRRKCRIYLQKVHLRG